MRIRSSGILPETGNAQDEISGWKPEPRIADNITFEVSTTTMTEGSTTTTYTYDDWGRTISKDDGTHSADYTWFAGDKLKQYDTTFPGESSVAFQYDGLGKRRLKLLLPPGGYTDSDYTWYRWDAGWNMIGEYAAGSDTGTTWDVGTLTRWYQGKAAHVNGAPDSTAYNYYLHDHLGSPRASYNQSKAAVARLDFSAYGSPMTTAGLGMDVGYTGHKWDGEMGVFYAPFRYYAPGQARWLSRDPAGAIDGPNVYSYAQSTPTYFLDQLGNFSLPGAVLGALGGCSISAITAAATGNARSVMCGCIGGGISGAATGSLIAIGIAGAVGAFAQCVCNRGTENASCCAKASIGGGVGSVIGTLLFGSGAAASGAAEAVEELMGALGAGVGGTLGGTMGEEACCN